SAAPELSLTAWQGGFLLLSTHALAKAAMFAAAGVVTAASARADVAGLGGTGVRLPLTVFAFGMAGAALIGLPPTGGFGAKWLLLQAAIGSGQWWWAAILLGGGLLTAAWVFRLLRHAFVPRPPGVPPQRPARV